MADDDKPDPLTVLERAQDVWALFCALQQAGFEKGEAIHLMQPCLIIGIPWKQELTR
jgi:hypothetical protein